MPWKYTAKEMDLMFERIRGLIKKGNGTLKGLVAIAIIIALGIAVILLLSPAPTEHVEVSDRISLTPTSTQIEIGDKVTITATIPSDLYLEWEVNDPSLGSIKKVSNEKAIFTAIKNGTAKISVTAPNTPYKDEVEIEIFTHPELKVIVLADALLETNQLYEYEVAYTGDSVSITEIYLTDELGNKVSGLLPLNMLRFEKGGTYMIKAIGVTYKETPIEGEVSFSVLPKIEAISTKPQSINLVSMAPSDIRAIEVFFKENLGLNVDLLKISREGKLVKDVDQSFVAILFTRDNNEERVWMRTEVNAFDYYPGEKNNFRTERIGSSRDGYVWTIAVNTNTYTQQISCVMAYPSQKGYYLQKGISYSDSGGGGDYTPSTPPSGGGGTGGGGQSPDIPPDDPGMDNPSPSPDI